MRRRASLTLAVEEFREAGTKAVGNARMRGAEMKIIALKHATNAISLAAAAGLAGGPLCEWSSPSLIT